jgi:predicted Na+-dependent transporter
MYASSIALVVVAAITIGANMGEYADSSVNMIVAVNGFFAILYAISGSLFRLAEQEKSAEKSNS